MTRYIPRLEREQIIEATRHTHALWGAGRSQEEHTAYSFEQLERAGPELLRYVGLSDETGLIASIKRYGLLLATRPFERPLRALGIGAVFTRLDARGKGAAATLLRELLGEARDLGYEAAFLYSDIDPDYYARLGFVPLSALNYRAQAGDLPRGGAFTIRAAEPGDLDAMISFYERAFEGAGEFLRPARSRAIWRYFRWRNRIHGEWILSEGGRDLGYVLASPHDSLRDLPGERARKTLWVDEWSAPGVPSERIHATLRAIAEREGAEQIGGWLMPGPREASFELRPRTHGIPMIASLTPGLTVDPERAALSSFGYF